MVVDEVGSELWGHGFSTSMLLGLSGETQSNSVVEVILKEKKWL